MNNKEVKSVKILSFAKINLSIDVQNVMENGYHPVDMIMQQLSFHDDVVVSFDENHEDFGIEIKTNKYYLPTDRRNLAYKAAELMIEKYGLLVPKGKISIDIFKRIPVAAGLAGGSGNGAAVLHGLNVLWNLKLSLAEICELGAELGSDVPFSVMGQARANHNLPKKIRKDPLATSCARATGTGTKLEPIKGIRKFAVISKPNMGVSTAEVYRGIDEQEITNRPDNDILEKALANNDLKGMYENYINVLEEYTLKAYPEVMKLKESLMKTDAEWVMMSGSGPTVFAIYKDIEQAKKACAGMREKNYEAYWTKTTR